MLNFGAGNGELKEDKKHRAFTYKRKDCSVRFYTSAGNLRLFGTEQATLLKKLHEINDQNKNLSPLPPSKKTDCNGDKEGLKEGRQNGGEPESYAQSTGDQSVILIQEPVIKNDDQFKSVIDFTTVMNEIAKLRAEIGDIKKRSQEHTTLDRVNIELLKCHKEIDDLKDRENAQKVYIQNLEDEKASLVTTIKLFVEERNANEFKTKPNDITTGSKDDEIKRTSKSNKTKKKKRNKNTDEPEGVTTSKATVIEEAIIQEQSSSGDKRKTTIIADD